MVKSHIACAYFETTCTQRESDRDWSYASDSGEKGHEDAAAGDNGDLEWKKRAGGAFPISGVSQYTACFNYLEGHLGFHHGAIYIQAWEAVIHHQYSGWKLDTIHERLSEADVKSHGDAIRYLRLSSQVVRPVSLQQIRREQKALEGVQSV